MRWTVLIPVKSLPGAKSRLAGASADAAAHERLVRAIRADTVAAARAADGVARVLFVVDRPEADGAEPVFVQTAPGLNAGLDEAARYAAEQWPGDGVAVLVGDLPALSAAELADALAVAAGYERAFVADAAGTGTTLLAVRDGTALRAGFGPGSAQRHARAATPVPAGPGLRQDVDTADDLRAAARLRLGPRTAAEVGRPAA